MPRGEPTRSVPVRLTERQRAECEEAAAAARLTLTGWIRAVAVEAARGSRAGVEATLSATSAQERVGTGRATVAAGPSRGPSRPAASPRRPHVRPAHHPTCKCGVCRPPKLAKS